MNPIEELYALYGGRILRYLLRLSGSRETAEDLTQETFARLLQAVVTFQGKSAVSTWLYGIARNVYREHVRRRVKAERVLRSPNEPPPGPDTDPEEMALRTEERAAVQTALQHLSETDREILILRDFEGLEFTEIAAVMGQSVNWARVTHFRAKQRFRNHYVQLEEGSHE